MEKEKKEIKVGYRFKKSTVEKIKQISAETGKSQADVIEIAVKEAAIFTKEELKQIRFAAYIAMQQLQDVGNLNTAMFAGEVERQKDIYNKIIKKVELLREYYK